MIPPIQFPFYYTTAPGKLARLTRADANLGIPYACAS